MNAVSSELLKRAYLFSLERHRFGVNKKADLGKVTVEANKDRLSMSKRLIEAEEYDAILTCQNELYNWCKARSMPSFIKKGFFLVSRDMADEFNARLLAGVEEMNILVPRFIDVYQSRIEEAKVALNGLFDQADYPPPAVVSSRFSIEWNWLAFSVPDDLPADVKAAEVAKLEQQFKDAEGAILDALRLGFAKLIDHAIERLTPEPGGAKKIFKDTTITNITDFIETFNARNLMNDTALKGLVEQAKGVLSGYPSDTPQFLRDSDTAKAQIAEQFRGIQLTLDGMIVERGRKFDLADE